MRRSETHLNSREKFISREIIWTERRKFSLLALMSAIVGIAIGGILGAIISHGAACGY